MFAHTHERLSKMYNIGKCSSPVNGLNWELLENAREQNAQKNNRELFFLATNLTDHKGELL